MTVMRLLQHYICQTLNLTPGLNDIQECRTSRLYQGVKWGEMKEVESLHLFKCRKYLKF